MASSIRVLASALLLATVATAAAAQQTEQFQSTLLHCVGRRHVGSRARRHALTAL
jgi:hypothetical protein